MRGARAVAALLALAPIALLTSMSACGLISGVNDFRVGGGAPDAADGNAPEASSTVDARDVMVMGADADDATLPSDTSVSQDGGADGLADGLMDDSGIDGADTRDSATPADSVAVDTADAADTAMPRPDSSVPDSADAAEVAAPDGTTGCTAGSITWKQTTTFSSATAITALTLPTPALSAKGDLLLAFLTGGANSATVPTLAVPAGWTLVGSATYMGASTSSFLDVYFKVASAQEPASFTWTSMHASFTASWMLDYSGVDASNPIDGQTGQDDGADAGLAGFPTPSLITSGPSELVLATFVNHDGNGGGGTWSTPAGMTQRAFVTDGAARQGASDELLVAAPGVVGPFVADVPGAQIVVLTHILALRPCP